MDLSRMPDQKKLELCRWYYRAGFFLLPFAWAVNSIWFFNEAFRRTPSFEEQKQIKHYVIFSMIGTILWTIALTAWIVTFQLNRAEWGKFADDISFITPLGMA